MPATAALPHTGTVPEKVKAAEVIAAPSILPYIH